MKKMELSFLFLVEVVSIKMEEEWRENEDVKCCRLSATDFLAEVGNIHSFIWSLTLLWKATEDTLLQ